MRQIQILVLASMLFPVAPASAETVGSWLVDTANEGAPFIATVNESGGALLKTCDLELGGCLWMLITTTRCTTSTTAPAIINGSNAASVTLTCIGEKPVNGVMNYRNAIADPDLVDKAVEQAPDGRLSIVLALEEGAFRVFRFQVSGAAWAMNSLRSAAAKFEALRRRGSTKDSTLY